MEPDATADPDGPVAAGAEELSDEARRPHLATVDGVSVTDHHHAQTHQDDGTVVYLPTHPAVAPDPDPAGSRRIFGEALEAVFDESQTRPPRHKPDLLSWVLLITSTLLTVIAIGWFAAATQRAAGGGEAGAFILLSAALACWYRNRPDELQHESAVNTYERYAGFVDRRVDPFKRRTELGIQIRREREHSETVRKERSRRVLDLGEAAYRLYRVNQLDSTLIDHAKRIELMERQMLVQDSRVNELMVKRASTAATNDETAPPQDG